MKKRLRTALTALAFTTLAATGCGGDEEETADEPTRPRGPAIAVIGDTPYGAEQVAGFRGDIAKINADPDVRSVIHLGDIQEGPSRCTDSYLKRIRSDFDTFSDPLVYTPGDNEWTDCHQPMKGGVFPAERLARLRSIFFDSPGQTLGRRPKRVEAQAAPFSENVRWVESGAAFTTLHVPGSNNGLEPWSDDFDKQMKEYASRLKANLKWLDEAFDAARAQRAVGVVVAMQADMWPDPRAARDVSGYDPIVAKLAERARAFRRPVLVLQGDSHQFKFDYPLRRGSPLHGVNIAAPNVRRVVVQGAESTPHEWLRVRVSRTAPIFTWDRVRLGP